jgi:dUTP pyrophosphatase
VYARINKMSLYLWIANPRQRSEMKTHLLQRRWTDSGLDIISSELVLPLTGSHIGLEIKTGVVAAALDDAGNPVPYLLLARSSTSLTPLRMSNQIGLADAGYRGELIARVDFVDHGFTGLSYLIPEGRRLFQIVQHNWLPWKKIVYVESANDLPAPPDNRGEGGFGSTGS